MAAEVVTVAPPRILKLIDLPEDCLHNIFSRFKDFNDQLHVARACRRFQAYFQRVWVRQINQRTASMGTIFCHVPNNDDKLFFLETMSLDIDSIKFSFSSLGHVVRNWRTLGVRRFPNCESFEIMGKFSAADGDIDNADIFRLHKYVPNIKYLRLNTYTNGTYLPKFQFLEECHLGLDRDLNKFRNVIMNLNVNELFTSLPHLRILDIRAYRVDNLTGDSVLKCTKLETLKLHLDTLHNVVAEVLSLPRLTTLSVNVNPLLQHHRRPLETFAILEAKADQLLGISIENDRIMYALEWDAGLTFLTHRKLRKFSFNHWPGPTGMLEKYLEMSDLEVLALTKWQKLTNDTVMRFIRSCRKLKHLEVSYCRLLNERLLRDIVEELNEQQRTDPLWIHYFGSGISTAIETNLNYWGQVPILKFRTSTYANYKCPNEYVNASYRGIEFEFEKQPVE